MAEQAYVVTRRSTLHGEWEYDDEGGYYQMGSEPDPIEVHLCEQAAKDACLRHSQDAGEAEFTFESMNNDEDDDNWTWASRIHLPPAQFHDWLTDNDFEIPHWLPKTLVFMTSKPQEADETEDEAIARCVDNYEIKEWWEEYAGQLPAERQALLCTVVYRELYVVQRLPLITGEE